MKTVMKYEAILFYFVLFLHLLPVLILTPFVTLDGPVHLYNARLMHDLILAADPITNNFFEFNPVIEPNLTGHAIMALSLSLFPPLITEKLILLLIILCFSIGYRRWIRMIETDAVWISWFIFPMIYNFTFLIGFFNFMIGLSLLPFFMVWWMRTIGREKTILDFLKGIFLLLAMYYSHILVLILAGILAVIQLQFSKEKKAVFPTWSFLFLIGLPGIYLTVDYLISHGSEGYHRDIQWLPFSKIVEDIANARYLIMYDNASEKRFTRIFSILLLAITLTGLKFRTVQKNQLITGIWFLLGLLLLFLTPDSFASGGIITPRLELWLALSLLLYLSSLRIPEKFSFPAAIASAGISLFMIIYHFDMQRNLSASAQEIMDECKFIRQPAVLLPVNFSSNWMEANLCAYVGAQSKVVILDNYEADYRLFPVVWKEARKPSLHAGNHAESSRPCINVQRSERITGNTIDYISFWSGSPSGSDSCSIDIRNQLHQFYTAPLDSGGRFLLYQRR